jgi:hypothetical protein
MLRTYELLLDSVEDPIFSLAIILVLSKYLEVEDIGLETDDFLLAKDALLPTELIPQ